MGRPTAGRGSNQYQTRGASRGKRTQTTAEFRSVIESEATAWVFSGVDNPEEDARRARQVRDANKLSRYAAHPDYAVRAEVAKRSVCPPALLAVLAGDADHRVAAVAIANPRCPGKALRRRVIQPSGSLSRPDTATWQDVANHPNADEPTLRHIAEHSQTWLQARVAANANCPTDLLDQYLGTSLDPSGNNNEDHDRVSLLANAAGNPRSDPQRVVALLEHPHPRVAQAAVANPSAPLDAVMKHSQGKHVKDLIGLIDRPDCPAAILERVVGSREARDSWTKALAHPHCPEHVLRRFDGSGTSPSDVQLLEAVINNPVTPTVTLESLSRVAPRKSTRAAAGRQLRQRVFE